MALLFSLSDEQKLFQESLERQLAQSYPFSIRQQAAESETGYSKELWRTAADMGWLAAPFPEDLGGLGGSMIEAGLVMSAFGRSLVNNPYAASVLMAGGAVMAGGTREQQEALIPGIASGERIVTFAHAEADARYDWRHVETTARPAGNGYVLNGRKSVVPFADRASEIIVAARLSGGVADAEGLSLFVVPASVKGLSLVAYRTHDGGRAGDVVLNAVRVDGSALIGAPGEGFALIEAALDRAAAGVCMGISGATWGVHDATLAYLKTRTQFGQPLSTFQALQHRIVDVYIRCQLAQSMAWDAVAACAAADPRERSRRISAAMVHVGEAGRFVAKEGVQLHGGIGMTYDLPIGHYLKRLAAIDTAIGDQDMYLDRCLGLAEPSTRGI